jgi:REP element-mobilizing transposase RayT
MSRPKRLAHVSYVGKAGYSLTFCGKSRRPAFRSTDLAAQTRDYFLRTAVDERFVVLAYGLMPDHAHLFVEGTSGDSDLKRFAKLSKQRFGAAYALASSQRLWQEGYYERIVRAEEQSEAVARYIVGNPVRAGLVSSAPDYPWSGSQVWTLKELVESVQ